MMNGVSDNPCSRKFNQPALLTCAPQKCPHELGTIIHQLSTGFAIAFSGAILTTMVVPPSAEIMPQTSVRYFSPLSFPPRSPPSLSSHTHLLLVRPLVHAQKMGEHQSVR